MVVATPRSSSTDARSAIDLVAAVPTPTSTSDSQPVMAENVCSSAHVPKATVPSPDSSRGRVTRARTIAQTLATPVQAVFNSTRRRNGRGPEFKSTSRYADHCRSTLLASLCGAS